MGRASIQTPGLAVFCVLICSNVAVAANPTWTVHPADTEKLKKWGLHVSYRLVINDFENPEYAFTITANVPKGLDALDATLSMYNGKGLIAMHHWVDTDGKCVADFTLGKQALKDAGFMVQFHRGKRSNPFSASGRCVFSLAEFASDKRYCTGKIGVAAPPKTTEFRMASTLNRHGPPLTIKVVPIDAFSNYEYDFHVTVPGRSDQHFKIRNGQPITKSDVRFADINGDGFLDITIVGGADHRGRDWYKTLIYSKDKSRYRWITDEPKSPDKARE